MNQANIEICTITASRKLDGLLDEVQVSSTALSSNWVWAAYESQKQNPTLLVYSPVNDSEEPLPDEDGDGIPDFWEQLHFGGATNAVADADNDGDGFDNLSEWISDTIPTNADSFFMLNAITTIGSAEIRHS